MRERFLASMDDDFNTAGAIAVLFDLLRTINVFISEQKLEGLQDEQRGNWALNRDALRKALTLLKELGGLLGLFRAPVAKPSRGDDELTGQLASLVSGIRTEAERTANMQAIPEAAAESGNRVEQLMQDIIALRAEARRTKNFAIADKIRNGLTALHITLEDRPTGTSWRRDG